MPEVRLKPGNSNDIILMLVIFLLAYSKVRDKQIAESVI